jgi:zinc/manganese transport system substrate-binding protein
MTIESSISGMVPIRTRTAVVSVAAGVLVLAGCGGDDNGSSEAAGSPAVVATTSVWADIVDAATCRGEAGIDVVGLIPPGADPHGYEASLQDRQAIDDAAAVVANGLDLEEGIVELTERVDGDRLIEVAGLPGVSVRQGTDDDHAEHEEEDGHDVDSEHEDEDHEDEDHEGEDHAEDDGHAHTEGDPHVWLDPRLVAGVIRPLTERIATATGVDAATLEECADDYAAEVQALDTEIASIVETLPAERRVLVTNHDAYGYFADRYGFEIAGTVIPGTSTLAETNAADLADLAATIEEHDVPAIFVDASASAADAESLASMAGVNVVALDTEAIGTSDGADSYVSMMRSNATAIVDALGR